MQILDDINGGVKDVIVEVHWLGWRCDLLGRAGVGPYPECFKAKHSCADCWWDTTCSCAYVPRPLLSSATETAEHCDKERCRCHAPRSAEEHCTIIESLRAKKWTSKKTRAEDFRDAGVARLYCVMDFMPNGDVTTDLPLDTSHLFFMGTTRQEFYWTVDDLISSGTFTWDDLNKSRKTINESLLGWQPSLTLPGRWYDK